MYRTTMKLLGEKDPELKRPLTPKEFMEAAINIDDGDPECGHVRTDQLMEAQLCAMGFEKGIEIIRETTRWYT